MRSKVVVGNWKLNGSVAGNEALLKALLREIPRDNPVACVVCVPSPFLAQVRALLEGTGIAWGAQDLSRFDQGAYTGEVSGGMLVELGCRYVLVGHSERRTLFGETDAIAAEKYVAARKAALTPVFCVGETLEERERGETQAVLARQVDALLQAYGATGLERGIIAYEPVWAIGTGRTATAAQADEAHAFIRARRRRGRSARPCRSSTGEASRGPTRRNCSRCRTSTAGWSAGRRWWPRNSWRSGGRPSPEVERQVERLKARFECRRWSS
jgi:triosephosphate isomerase (TIM)